MNLIQHIQSRLQYYDRHADEVTDKCVMDEYSYLFKLSSFYVSFKTPLSAFLHLLQFIFYMGILILHIVLITITIMNSELEDFLIVSNSAHIGLILILFIGFLILIPIKRVQFNIVHKMIGEGVYIYENEEICEEEIKIRIKYDSIKRKMKIILPILNVIAGLTVVMVGPWLNSLLGVEDSRTYTKNGIYIKLPIACWYPFDLDSSGNYYICFLGQIIVAYIVIVILASVSYLYFTTMIHLVFQLERLIISVGNIEKRATTLFKTKRKLKVSSQLNRGSILNDPQYIECIEFCLRRNIIHHQKIFRFFKVLNELLKGPIFVTFLSTSGILAMTAVVIIVGFKNPGIMLGTLSVAAAELVNITGGCKAGQLVIDLNVKLHRMMYNIRWYNWPRRANLYLAIEQTMTCQDLEMIGLFSVRINMETYAKILNTAYSYFSLLIAFKSS